MGFVSSSRAAGNSVSTAPPSQGVQLWQGYQPSPVPQDQTAQTHGIKKPAANTFWGAQGRNGHSRVLHLSFPKKGDLGKKEWPQPAPHLSSPKKRGLGRKAGAPRVCQQRFLAVSAVGGLSGTMNASPAGALTPSNSVPTLLELSPGSASPGDPDPVAQTALAQLQLERRDPELSTRQGCAGGKLSAHENDSICCLSGFSQLKGLAPVSGFTSLLSSPTA